MGRGKGGREAGRGKRGKGHRRIHGGTGGDSPPPTAPRVPDGQGICRHKTRFWLLVHQKCRFFQDSAPDPAGAAYSAPPDTLAGGEVLLLPSPQEPLPTHGLRPRISALRASRVPLTIKFLATPMEREGILPRLRLSSNYAPAAAILNLLPVTIFVIWSSLGGGWGCFCKIS